MADNIGDVWLVKNPRVHIQGRYNLIQRMKNKPFLRAVAIGGPFLAHNKLIIGPAKGHVLWNGEKILLQDGNGTFKVDDLFSITARHDTKLVQDTSRTTLGVDINLPLGIKMIVNRHPRHLGVRISVLGALLEDGIDGECGNYNGNADDDTAELIQARLGHGILISDLLFPNRFNPFSEHPDTA